MSKVLFTSVCRPLGEQYGDGKSVGYELLYGQVTRAQGLFSPRANHIQFGLEYIAENLDAPTAVLHYPSKDELLRELEKGYDWVGVAFVLATFHRMKEVVALIRKHAPSARIVLGGYGTVLSDEVLLPFCDEICREEGVGFMRRLLDEPELAPPFGHPLVVSRLKLFGHAASRTGMVFAGLGCPNGCDFCCTSHFFKRKHIRLLPTGRAIYDVVERYLEVEPGMSITILDEDFLLNRKRAMEFRDCVVKGGKPVSIFAFASVRALSKYTVTEILEMGIDGVWIGYEGTRAGFAKQEGRPVRELFRELYDHGVSVLASMIVGLPYQTPEIIEEEMSGLLELEPVLTQFLIYGPTPGTPFFARVMEEGLLHRDLADDREKYYRNCTGFNAMVDHPTMSPGQIEAAQARCFREEFARLGPSVYRSLAAWLRGYEKLRDSESPFLRRKAQRFAFEIRRAYPIFLAGKVLGPNAAVRRRIGELQRRIHRALGAPTGWERVQSATALMLAARTGVTLKLGLQQHPRLTRHTYRMPEESVPSRAWRRLRGACTAGHEVAVELRPESTVWVSVAGRLSLSGAETLAAGLRDALKRRKERLVLDLGRLAQAEREAIEKLAEYLTAYRDRVRLVLPPAPEFAALVPLFAIYR
jgi:radical SAM superfamily enzyme YgiQ (UPF0313 family)